MLRHNSFPQALASPVRRGRMPLACRRFPGSSQSLDTRHTHGNGTDNHCKRLHIVHTTAIPSILLWVFKLPRDEGVNNHAEY